jgi:hypothetical protein
MEGKEWHVIICLLAWTFLTLACFVFGGLKALAWLDDPFVQQQQQHQMAKVFAGRSFELDLASAARQMTTYLPATYSSK